MVFVVKKFDELSLYELYEILRLRVDVFVVEQNCPYREMDDYDFPAYHVLGMDEGKLIAYLRVLPENTKFKEASLGRVISAVRRKGMGTKLVKKGIEVAQQFFYVDTIRIEAQSYASEFYEKCGFYKVSDEFIEDGIPHIQMLWKNDSKE